MSDRDHCQCEEPGHIIGGDCMDCGCKVGHPREDAKPISDGGPAFPMGANEYSGTGPCWGMSLRDYFAAKAMQGAFTGSPIPSSEDEKTYIAMHAYRMADAMLAAREKQS